MPDLDQSIYVYTVKSNPNFISIQSYNSAGIYIRNERLKTPTYGFKDYMETVVRHGAQDISEKALLEKGQHPYQHTRKQAVSTAAEQMVSNNPTLRKVSLPPGPIFIVAMGRARATGR